MADDETREDELGEVEDEMDEADEVEDVEEEGDEGDEEKEPSLEEKLKEAIDVKVDEVGTLRRRLTITVPRDTLDGQVSEQYDELRREAMVPGFRKGRAPRRLLEKRFGTEVNETLVQQLVGTGYLAAIDKTELKVLGDPLIAVPGEEGGGETLLEVQEAMEKIKLPSDGPLVYSCEVEVRPTFELPELKGIPLKKPKVEVTEEDVDNSVKRLLATQGVFEPVVDGIVQTDDALSADVKMTSEGTVLKEEQAVRLAARPQKVDGVALADLGEKLAGAKIGDTITASGQIPDDYYKAEFRGKQADIEFKIREIQRLNVPELSEAFLKTMGFENEAELRKWIREDMEGRLDDEIRTVLRAQLAQYLVEKVSFDLPERLSNRMTARVVTRRLIELYQQGMPQAEVEKHMDELQTSAQAEAQREMKLAFIMESLAEKIEVEVSEGEINAAIATIAHRQGRRYDRVRDELAKQDAISGLFVGIRDQKIMDMLIQDAEISEEELPDSSGKSSADKPAKPKRKSSAKKKEDKPDEGFADET